MNPRIMLLDTAVAAMPLRPAVEAIWKQRINARRYKFDADASRRTGELMRDSTDLIVDNIEFARPPFPTTYIEIDTRALWEGWRPTQPMADHADLRAGFLIHGGAVVIVASGARPDTQRADDLPDEMICGITFRINRPQSVPFAKLIGEPEDDPIPDLIKQAYVFGGQRQIHVDDPRVRKLSTGRVILPHDLTMRDVIKLPDIGAWSYSQIAAHFDVLPAFTKTPSDIFAQLCFQGGGDPLILTAALLLLGQPSKQIVLTHVAREQGIWKGKLKSFKEHHVVTLHLNRKQSVRDLLHTTDRASPGRHEVAGHWKNYNRSSGCAHRFEDGRRAWEPVSAELSASGDYKRYWCPLCLQRRTRVDEFMRGTGGLITHEYAVKE